MTENMGLRAYMKVFHKHRHWRNAMTTNIIQHHIGYGRVARRRRATPNLLTTSQLQPHWHQIRDR